MVDIPSIIVVEPSSEQSKHRAAGIFARKESYPDIPSIKKRLKELRENSRNNHTSLLDELKRNLSSHKGVRLTFATDAKQAASYIKQVAGDTNLASINKSNVLVNELRPELENLGVKTYLRYFTEFNNFEKEKFKKTMEDYWSLPGLHGRSLVESFEVRKRITEIPSPGMRDYIAVLGVNAISANDGSVFFLQHMSNITKDLEQAKKIILVVSLEKILPDSEEALFHTKAMGIFGLESILLDLAPHEEEMYDFDSLPPVAGAGSQREIHVLLLDNGRSNLLADGYSDLFLCIDCRACARQCPIGLHVMFERGMVYSPKNYLFGFLQGWLPTTEECLHCGRCQVECPVDIDIPTLIWKAQFEHYAKHARSLKKRMLDDPELLAKLGSLAAPFSNWLTNLAITKIFMQILTGVHRNAHLPTFHRQTFRSWFKGGRGGR